MAQNETNNINKVLNICKANGESFYGLKLRKYSVESVVMSLGDKISGDVYYQDNALPFTMQEYVEYDGVKYYLVNPPTVVREGLVKDNSGLNGMTKYSLTFYHPMYMLSNFPFTDVAVQEGEELYLAQNKTFSWIGNLFDFIAKLNKNLETTEWVVNNCIQHWVDENEEEVTEEWAKASELSEVLTFDKNFISDALKTAYDSWNIPFTITKTNETAFGVQKNFLIEFGTPNQEILGANDNIFVFRFGQGVGLKNNSRTPRNNKIVTRIVGEGAERNIPYGYPQIRWYGDQTWEWTEYVDNDKTKPHTATAFPIYSGILDGQWVKLIKHPFTRTTLMPSVYVQDVFNKVSPYSIRELPSGTIVPNPNYNRNGVIRDYYDATSDYPHEINPNAPSTEMHQFEDIYPRLGTEHILDAYPIDAQSKGSQVSVTQKLSDVINFISARITEIHSEPESEEEIALKGLRDFLEMVNDPQQQIAISYYANSTSGSYQYNCVVQQKGGSEVGVWVIWYTSDTFNIVAQEAIEDDQQEALDWDDTYDAEKNEYVQSYFKIKLPTLNFDMYACASITENMQIYMRSGACIGCTFDIMVDWDDYKRNFYDSNGDFAPTGSQRDLNKYPNSENSEIEVVCKKDLQTFGTLMPNKYQYPRGVDSSQAHPYAGDEFVILGISLPENYITTAQYELDNAMRAYMLENNIYYYDYPLKFDEHFLVTHQDILAQIKNNSAIHFLYTNEEITLYVKQIVIKYGEGVLPQWDITLTDKIEVVLNKIGQAIDGVGKLRVEIENIQSNAEYDKIETSLAIRRQEQSGKAGRFYYYAGTWVGSASPDSYVVSESQAPFFDYIREITTEDEQHHEITVQVQEFWLFNPATTGSYTQEQMGEPSLTAEGWEQMVSDFKYLITEAIFAQFAHLGSAIISGDWMISQHGTIGGVASTNFGAFDDEHPNDNTGTNFIPNYAIDLLTGTTFQHDAYLDNAYVAGSLFASSIQTKFCEIPEWDSLHDFVVGRTTEWGELPDRISVEQGVWNFNFVDGNVNVILPTNQYEYIGQRVILYNPINSGVGLSDVVSIIATDVQYDVNSGDWEAINNNMYYFSGIGVFRNTGQPVQVGDYRAIFKIEFVDGLIELMCVPSSQNHSCDWCVVNICATYYRLYYHGQADDYYKEFFTQVSQY